MRILATLVLLACYCTSAVAGSGSDFLLFGNARRNAGTAVAAIPDSFFGFHSNSVTDELPPPWDVKYVRVLQMGGNGTTACTGATVDWRRQFRWAEIECADGAYDWSVFDASVIAMLADGVDGVIYPFDKVPPWARGADQNPTDWNYLYDFIDQVLARFALHGMPVVAVEGFNEWSNSCSEEYYCGTAAAITTFMNNLTAHMHANHPGIPVVMAAVNAINQNNTTSGYPSTFPPVRTAPNFDIMAVHGYRFLCTWDANADIAVHMTAFLSFMASKGYALTPKWITEVNIEDTTNVTCDDVLPASFAIRANYMAQFTLLAAVKGFAHVDPYIWAPYLPGATGPYSLGNVGVANAVGLAWQSVRTWLLGAHSLVDLDTDDNDTTKIIDMRLANGHQAQAVWRSTNVTSSYTAPLWAVKYNKIDGTSTAVTGGVTSVTIGFSPILFEGV